MAGDYNEARQSLRKFCKSGFCVALQETDYIYTGGEEKGFCVTVINYPRKPLSYDELEEKTKQIAITLCRDLYQGSYTIETPIDTQFYSRRPGD
jgi:hypothetical protein